MSLSEIMDVRRLWARDRQRYRGVAHDHPSETELRTFRKQPPHLSSLPTTEDLRSQRRGSPAKDDRIPEDEEATDGSDRDSSVDSAEDNSPSKSKSGWIDGVYLCAKLVAVLLFLNLVLIVTVAGLSSKHSGIGGALPSKVIYAEVPASATCLPYRLTGSGFWVVLLITCDTFPLLYIFTAGFP